MPAAFLTAAANGLENHARADTNALEAFHIRIAVPLIEGLWGGLGGRLLAGAALRARCKPRKHIPLRIPDAASPKRAEETGAITSESVLIHGVGMDAKDRGHLLAIERAALRGVGEQLTELLESQVGIHAGHSTSTRALSAQTES